MHQLEETNRSLEQEIAERRLAEAQLRRLYAAIENTAESIIIATPNGIIEIC
jgi:phosphoglycerate-specific signal transduction histidine kinase